MAGVAERVSQIVETLVFPDENDPIRYNNDVSSQPTACKTLTQDFKIDWQAATTDKQLPATDTMIFLFRHPARALIKYDNNASGAVFQYRIPNSAGSYTFTFEAGATNVRLQGGPADQNSTYQPHGTQLYPALEDGRIGYWCDNDGTNYSTIRLNFSGTLTTMTGGAMTAYVWNGACWEFWDTVLFANTVATYTFAAPPVGGAYMAVDVTIGSTATTASFIATVIVISASGPGVWCHISVPQLNQLVPIMQGARVLAAGVKWQNYASDLDESGKVVAVNVSPGQPWQQLTVSQNSLSLLQGYKTLLAKNGYRGFLKIDDETDVEFQQDVGTYAYRGNTIGFAAFPLRERSSYLAVCMSVAATAGRQTSITVSHALEYQTNSKIQETRPPHTPGVQGYTYDEWTVAIQKLAEIPQHHGSETTWRKILEGMSNKRARV